MRISGLRILAAAAAVSFFWGSCGPGTRDSESALVKKQRALLVKVKEGDPKSPYRVPLPPGAPDFPENPANPLTNAGVQLGRWLFYDPILSRDGTMSCFSCHVQEHAFADGRRFSPGIHGENVGRNTMMLVNLAWDTHFFWDGRAPTLEAQALIPIQNPKELDQPLDGLVEKLRRHPVYPEMFALAFGDAEITPDRIGKAIAQFVRTVVSFESPLTDMLRVQDGKKRVEDIDPELRPMLLSRADEKMRETINLCVSCHTGEPSRRNPRSSLYGGSRITSNGLDQKPSDPGYAGTTGNPADFAHFKVPNLRNISVTAPYMHDGRFATLEEVIEHYDHGIRDFRGLDPLLRDKTGKPKRLNLSAEEKKNIIKYLSLMTDQALLHDERYANPFSPP